MGWRTWKRYQFEVRDKVRHKPHLRPIFEHVLDIPRRVFEYHPDLFIVFNKEAGGWEVHSLQQEDDTFVMNVRFKHLDARLLRDIRRNDVRVHGKAILERIRKSKEDWERRRERDWKNWKEAVVKETRTAFAKAAWEGSSVISGPGSKG